MGERFQQIIEPVKEPFFPALDLTNALLISIIGGSASQCTYEKCCIVSNGLASTICTLYLLTHLALKPCLARFDKITLPSLEAMTMLVSAFSLAANVSQTTTLLTYADTITNIVFYTTWAAISISLLHNVAPLAQKGFHLMTH